MKTPSVAATLLVLREQLGSIESCHCFCRKVPGNQTRFEFSKMSSFDIDVHYKIIIITLIPQEIVLNRQYL